MGQHTYMQHGNPNKRTMWDIAYNLRSGGFLGYHRISATWRHSAIVPRTWRAKVRRALSFGTTEGWRA